MCECIGVNVLLSLCYKCQCVYICTYTANKVNLNLNLNLYHDPEYFIKHMLLVPFNDA